MIRKRPFSRLALSLMIVSGMILSVLMFTITITTS